MTKQEFLNNIDYQAITKDFTETELSSFNNAVLNSDLSFKMKIHIQMKEIIFKLPAEFIKLSESSILYKVNDLKAIREDKEREFLDV